MDELLEIIREINQEKLAKYIVPNAALYSEIVTRINMPHEDIKPKLNNLVKEGKLIWFRTLNDYSFQIKEQ